jgi:hypothetical protein
MPVKLSHLLVASALTLSYQSPISAAPEEALQESEERLDDGLKAFGYLAGLARGCVAEVQQADLEREAVDLHGGIGRLFGTDRAFLFSASFGYGTSITISVEECEKVIATYEARVEQFRSGQRAAK